jgi:hypothetical protein
MNSERLPTSQRADSPGDMNAAQIRNHKGQVIESFELIVPIAEELELLKQFQADESSRGSAFAFIAFLVGLVSSSPLSVRAASG